jgi:beta-lactam-binding protein with PASTA domain
MNIIDFFKKHILLANLLLAAGLIPVILFGLMLWLDRYTNHGEAIEVPDIKGLSVEAAAPLLQAKELNYLIIDSLFVKNAIAGTIIETVPPIGTTVKKGRTIYLTINSFFAQLLAVPDVIDLSQRQALSILRSAGFESVQEKIVSSPFRGLVVGLETEGKTLSAGDKIPADSKLILLISSGDSEINPDSESSENSEEIWVPEITEEESWN